MRYLILVFSLLFVTFSWSQQLPILFKGRVSNSDNGGNEAGVTISVVQNGTAAITTQSSSSGKYSLTGQIDKSQPFDIVFSKGGMVSKKVHFDFVKMNQEDIPPGEFRPVESLDIDIFTERPGLDFSFLDNEPVASFDWNTRELAPRLDGAGASAMKKRISDLLSSAEKEAQELEQKYVAAITAADAAYLTQDYQTALTKYEEALGYKPTEKHPSDRIVELDALLKAQREKELVEQQSREAYDNLITAADNLRGQKKLAEAVSKYKEALALRTQEQYPKDQIATLEAQIEQAAKEAAAQEAYDAAMEKGAMFLKQNSYKAARDNYEEASRLKPSEQLPKDKLALIAEKLKEAEGAAEKKQKYDAAIAAADAAFTAEDYKTAKTKYEEALTFEAASSYAKGRLDICNEKLKDAIAEEERLKKIADLLALGQTSLDAKKFDEAIGTYNEVLAIEAENATAKEKKALAEKLKKESDDQAANNQKFNDLVANGDAAVVAENFGEGISKYEEALAIKPDTAVDKKLADAKAKFKAKNELAEKSEQFKALVEEGNKLLAEGKLEDAKSKFVAAQAIDATSAVPPAKITEIDGLLAGKQAEAEKKANYEAAIKAADQLFGEEKWATSKSKYQEALTFASDPAYANGKIEAINAKLNENAATAERAAKYDAAIAAADAAFKAEKWNDSKTKYLEAIGLTDDPAFAQGKVDAINKILADQESDKAKKAEIEKLLADGQKEFDQGKLESAKVNYEKVIAIEAANPTATAQIEKINSALAALKSDAEKDAAFAKLKQEGFQLADAKKYPEALSKLQEAMSLKQDTEVQTRIDAIKKEQNATQEIASLLADGEALYVDKKYEDAKSKFEKVLAAQATNAEAKAGLEKTNQAIANLESQASETEKFERLKQEGIAAKEKALYDDAKAKLNAALQIKDDNAVRAALEEIRLKENELAQMQGVDQQYNQLMSDASNLANNGSFEQAIKKYEEAKVVKPSEKEPDVKIADVRKRIEEEKLQAKTDAEYRALIDAGNRLVTEEKYIDAIESFNKALALKPTEVEPVEKARNAEDLAKNSKTDADKAVEKNLRIAEEKINSGEYERAEQILSSTQGLGPGPERIAEIESLRDRIKVYKKRDADYAKLLVDGQNASDNNKLEKALTAYREANRLKENEQLPKDKIAELEKKINELASSEQSEKLYEDFMTKGQTNQDSRNYDIALSAFQNALEVKKKDVAATNKIAEIQQILDDLANQNAADMELRNRFNAIVSAADAKFNSAEYLPAKTKYEEALQLIPNDNYVKLRIDECLKREGKISEELADEQYRKLIEAADKNLSNKDYQTAKDRYNNAVAMRSNDPYPKKKLAEIDAILNPASVASLKLVDPGVPMQGSILDGMALLQQAQIQRDAFEKQKLQTKLDAADSELTSRADERTSDREYARQEIVEIYEGTDDYSDNADMKRNDNVEILRKSEKELSILESDNRNLDYKVNIGDQVQLNQITKSVELNYGENTNVYMDNAETMSAYDKALEEAFNARDDSDYNSSISSDQRLILAKETVVNEMIDDFKERDNVRQQVQGVQINVNNANDELSVADYEVNHVAKGVIEDVYTNVNDRTTEDTQKARDNNEELKGIQTKINTTSSDLGTSETVENYAASASIEQIAVKYDDKAKADADAIAENGEELRVVTTRINDKDLAMGYQETQFAYSADRQMEGYKQKSVGDMSGMDENRKDAVEVLKKNNKGLASAQDGIQEANQDKSLANKQIIENETVSNGAVDEKADAANSLNVEGMVVLNKKASADYSSAILSDEQERQNSQDGIATVYESNSNNTKASTDKQEENSEKIDNSKKVVSSEVDNRVDANKDKVYGAANKIHNMDDVRSEKPIIANSLGEEYPEGVTEESFAQNDQNGLMKSIVTRRIVVIEGHADVFLRTQTLDAITYSKNGKPITEYDWNSHTQGPDLVRHTK